MRRLGSLETKLVSASSVAREGAEIATRRSACLASGKPC
jgi:hypothetical protein